MKKSARYAMLVVLAATSILSGCGNGKDVASKVETTATKEVSYYENTDLVELKTFTNITGVPVTSTQDTPESNSVSYNYILDNNAEGFAAVLKYETYLSEFGFKKLLTSDKISTYAMDDYYIVVGIFNPQDNIIQYAINIPNEKHVSIDDIKETTTAAEKETIAKESETAKDNEASYLELCAFVDDNKYDQAIKCVEGGEVSLDYKETKDYYNYAKAMQLYKNTEYLKYADISKVATLLSEEVSSDFKDAGEIAEKIKKELKMFSGTYICEKDSKQLYNAHYLSFEDDGIVKLILGKKGSAPQSSPSTKFYLAYVNLENESYYVLAYPQATEYCQYGIVESDGKLVLVKSWGNTDKGMYAGTFKKQ